MPGSSTSLQRFQLGLRLVVDLGADSIAVYRHWLSAIRNSARPPQAHRRPAPSLQRDDRNIRSRCRGPAADRPPRVLIGIATIKPLRRRMCRQSKTKGRGHLGSMLSTICVTSSWSQFGRPLACAAAMKANPSAALEGKAWKCCQLRAGHSNPLARGAGRR